MRNIASVCWLLSVPSGILFQLLYILACHKFDLLLVINMAEVQDILDLRLYLLSIKSRIIETYEYASLTPFVNNYLKTCGA